MQPLTPLCLSCWDPAQRGYVKQKSIAYGTEVVGLGPNLGRSALRSHVFSSSVRKHWRNAHSMPGSVLGLGTKDSTYYFSPVQSPVLPNSYSSPHLSLGENKMLNASVSFGVTVRFSCQVSWNETVECMKLMPKPFRGMLSYVPSTQSHLHSPDPVFNF